MMDSTLKPTIPNKQRAPWPRLALTCLGLLVVVSLPSYSAAQAETKTDQKQANQNESNQDQANQNRAQISQGKATARIADSARIPRHRLKVFATAQSRFRWAGEAFYYSIRLNGAEAMRASVRAGDVRNTPKQSYIPVSAKAESVGFFRSVYPMNDRADVYINPYNLLPHRSEKLFREAGKSRTYQVDYTHNRYKARVEKTKKEREYRFSFAIPPKTFDMLSWVYDLRTQEMGAGKKFVYYIYDGWKLSRVHLEVVGKEDVYTPMGWFKTWKLKFRREVVRTQKKSDKNGNPVMPHIRIHEPNEHNGHFYLSRDENLLPVKLTMKTSFGMSEALLLKYTPAGD